MKIVVGVLFWVVAVGVGLYVGIYLCLYGGIVDAINAFAEPMNTSAAVWGIIRAIFSEFFGVLAALIPALIGTYLIASDDN